MPAEQSNGTGKKTRMTDYAELAKRLNEAVEDETKRGWRLVAAAAEAIDALRAENERLKENLMDAQGEIHYLKNRAEF